MPRSRTGTMGWLYGFRVTSEERSLTRDLVPPPCVPFLRPPAARPVILGAGLAPGLAGDGGCPAVHAYAEGSGLLAFGLGDSALHFFPLRGLGAFPVVLPTLFLPGDLGRGRLDQRFRLSGPCGRPAGRFPDAGLPGLGPDARIAKLKPRWDVHLSGDDPLGCAGESLSSVLGE